MQSVRTFCSLAAAALVVSSANAGTTTIHYGDIQQGVGPGFGFSVIHTPTNDHGNGSLLYRMFSTLTAVYDDVDDGDGAGSLTFTQFDGQLFEENDLNPINVGPLAGSITLRASSTLNLQDGTDGGDFLGSTFVEGLLQLTISIIGQADRDIDIQFKAISYNPLANRFDPNNPYTLGLWGATPEVFTGDINADSLGFDLFAMVPLPNPAALGALGLGVVGVLRRRRLWLDDRLD